MKKAKYLLKRMVSLNFKNMFDVINKVHIKTNKPKLVIFLDMVWLYRLTLKRELLTLKL